MPDLLNDKVSLDILNNICAGKGVFVNYTWLSRHLNKHRKTIKSRVDGLVHAGIINPPVCPFIRLYREYPLMIIVFASLPETRPIKEWLRSDKNIFAAFKIREGDHNIMIFEFHNSVSSYQIWRDELVKVGKIPPRKNRMSPRRLYFSTDFILKYEPNAPLGLIGKDMGRRKNVVIEDYEIDKLTFQCIILLFSYHYIWRN